jgi:hypothetical protein
MEVMRVEDTDMEDTVAVVDTEVVDTEEVGMGMEDTVAVVGTEEVGMDMEDTVAVGTEATAMDIMRKGVDRNTTLNTTQVMAVKVIRVTKVITNMIKERKDSMTRRATVDTTMITGVRSQNIMKVAVILANIITVRREKREQITVKTVAIRKDTALRVSTTFTRRTNTKRIMSSMTSTMREANTASTENTTDIMSIRREVTKKEDITTQNIMRSIMERRAITIRVTIMMITRATRKNMATKSTTDMKMIMVKRVAMKKERNGHTVVAQEVAVDMEVDMEAVGTGADMGVGTEADMEVGTEVVDTEMEFTGAVDIEVDHTEVDMAVYTAETMVVVVVVFMVGEIKYLNGLYFRINIDILQLLECYFLVSK